MRRRLDLATRVALAGEIVATTARVRLLLRREALPEVIAELRDSPPAHGLAANVDADVLGHAVRRVLGHLPGDTRCLTQSLVLTALLARRGVPASVVIAVSTNGAFAAHAWVERDGRPLLPRGSVFSPIVQL